MLWASLMEIRPADFAGRRQTVYHIICCCEVLGLQRYKFFGKVFAEPEDISMASLKDLCLFVRGTGLMNQC
jgi:hypothetical protein